MEGRSAKKRKRASAEPFVEIITDGIASNPLVVNQVNGTILKPKAVVDGVILTEDQKRNQYHN